MRRSPENRGNKELEGGFPFSGERQRKLPLVYEHLQEAQERGKREWRRLLPNLQGVSGNQWVKIGLSTALFLLSVAVKGGRDIAGNELMRWSKIVGGDFTRDLGKRLLKNAWKNLSGPHT